jgi:hypothetical protein
MSHEGSCCIPSIVLLNETNGGVHKQQDKDSQKIFPIWWPALQTKFKINAQLVQTEEVAQKKT